MHPLCSSGGSCLTDGLISWLRCVSGLCVLWAISDMRGGWLDGCLVAWVMA